MHRFLRLSIVMIIRLVHPGVHLGHPPSHHGSLLQPLLQLLLSQLLFDVLTKMNRTFGLLAHLGVIAAECDQLLANRTAAIGLPLTLPGMTDHSFHLVTARRPTIGITALAGVNQAVDTALYGRQAVGVAVLVGVVGGLGGGAEVEAQLLHTMWMT